jgi:hypothetical protein
MLSLLLMLACGDKKQDSAVEPATEETQEVEDTAVEPDPEAEVEDTAQDTAQQ